MTPPPRKSTSNDLFEDTPLDPVRVAAGRSPDARPFVAKRKAGFYLSAELLERFTRTFYELKLAGAHIENKSALVEAALRFALDDIDRGGDSRILSEMGEGHFP